VPWPELIDALRPVLLGCGLTEERKWHKPCFCHDGRNVVILQEMKDFLALMFFQGALLTDPEGILEEQGENTRSARRICVRSLDDVARIAPLLPSYVAEAIRAEDEGRRVEAAPELVLVAELQERLDEDPDLRRAFDALTPGRRREYHLHIASAKQASTRAARVDKLAPRILAGKGLRDR
jgi:uncharacterized protein YdeI (YjbR/CyaY-like superfamily)